MGKKMFEGNEPINIEGEADIDKFAESVGGVDDVDIAKEEKIGAMDYDEAAKAIVEEEGIKGESEQKNLENKNFKSLVEVAKSTIVLRFINEDPSGSANEEALVVRYCEENEKELKEILAEKGQDEAVDHILSSYK
ncbi:MAG: hypothetical protein ABFQ53_01185 [Patescibacteria group bacterium]